MKTYKEITEDFTLRGIPTNAPNFYDHPNFILAERLNPNYLNNSAFFVASRPYSEEYLKQAEVIITKAATLLHKHLKENGRQGACVDITGILSRILEKHGVWCASIKGSCTVEFPPSSNEEATYFWSVDNREFTAGHSWLFAPPFNIVDITIGEQAYSGKKKKYMPKLILAKGGTNSTAEIEDIISPTAISDMQRQGIPRTRLLESGVSQMEEVQRFFPVKIVESYKGVSFKFCPVAIHASEEPLEGFKNMDFKGKAPYKLYKKYFEKSIGFIYA
jgi:hypothetical protein